MLAHGLSRAMLVCTAFVACTALSSYIVSVEFMASDVYVACVAYTTSDQEHANDLRLNQDTLNGEKDGVSWLKGRSFGIVPGLPLCARAGFLLVVRQEQAKSGIYE